MIQGGKISKAILPYENVLGEGATLLNFMRDYFYAWEAKQMLPT